jgi:PAS domain S-box-containing protein
MGEQSDERVYRIGELAKLSSLPVSTLRLWYQQGFIGLRKTDGGHRLFTDSDLTWVLQARDLTQGRYMTADLASTIDSLLEADEEPVIPVEPAPMRVLRHDPNYERMLDLAAQNARLFVEQRELAGKLSQVAADLSLVQDAYKTAVERIAECLWSVEVQPSGTWVFRRCTPAIFSITGYPSEKFIAEPARWFHIIHPDDRARLEEAFNRAYLGATINEEYRIVRADGVERWVRNSVQPSLDYRGTVSRLDGVIFDITERKIAELDSRANEQKLRLAVESFPDSVFTHDRHLRYTSAINPIGTAGEESVVGQTVWDVLPEEEAEQVDRIRRKVLETGQSAREVVQVTLSGQTRYRDIIVTPSRGPNGELDGVITYSRDLTDQVLLEKSLRADLENSRRSEWFYKNLLDNLPGGIWVLARDGKTLYTNQMICTQLGFEHEELIGKLVSELGGADAEEKIHQAFSAASANEVSQLVLTLATRAGKQLSIAFKATALTQPDEDEPVLLLVAGA